MQERSPINECTRVHNACRVREAAFIISSASLQFFHAITCSTFKRHYVNTAALPYWLWSTPKFIGPKLMLVCDLWHCGDSLQYYLKFTWLVATHGRVQGWVCSVVYSDLELQS